MNTRAKGNRFQADVARWLRERGWTVRNFPVSSTPMTIKGKRIFVSRPLDVFGADLYARKSGKSIWIQASMSGGVHKRVEEYLRYFDFLHPGESLQIWLKTRTGNINVYDIDIKLRLPMKLGKVIRGAWFTAEGSRWQFGEKEKP